MIKVKNAILREGTEGTSFVSLELTGDLELSSLKTQVAFMLLRNAALFPPPISL